MTKFDPFSNPNITFNGKTLEERARELDAEEKAREREARKAELLARKAAREAAANGMPATEPASESQTPSQTPSIVVPPVTPSPDFKIELLTDRFRIHNVSYRGEKYVFDWSKELLDNKKQHTQEQWTTLLQDPNWQQTNGVWGLADAPAYNATIFALYNNQNHKNPQTRALVQTMRNLFSEDFTPYYMMTSTRITYKSRGNDVVVHEWNFPGARTLKEKIVGEDDYIKPNCGFDKEVKAVLETDDLAMVEQAYEWIGKQGYKPYLFRLNRSPSSDDERAVVLGLSGYYNRFNINIYFNIYSSRPARGWSATRAKSP